jgi:adenosylhomocysteine nucleosidase
MKTVIIVSADAEWRVVKELFPNLGLQLTPFGESAHLTLDTKQLILFHGGWGKISAAASTQYVIDHYQPDLLVNLGTCGGFSGTIQTGTVILVERTLVYDILEQMGDSAEAIAHYASSLDLSWLPKIFPYPVLRGLLVSADRDIVVDDIPILIEKYGAVAADWESGAIAWVAKKNGTRLLILRAVTDLVGEGGGEAYGNIELFHERTKIEMKKLFEKLPEWIRNIGYQ